VLRRLTATRCHNLLMSLRLCSSFINQQARHGTGSGELLRLALTSRRCARRNPDAALEAYDAAWRLSG
jgi:hypothetical protein